MVSTFQIGNLQHCLTSFAILGPAEGKQILGSVSSPHGSMNPAHHRKSNSNSVNSHAAVMSGKQQMGSGNGSFGNMKFVKPSELSLDLISPSGIRNMGIKGAHGGLHN